MITHHQLSTLLDGLTVTALRGNPDARVERVRFDSREVEAGDLFVAVRGTQVDGHDYLDKAIAQGATVVVVETLPADLPAKVTVVQVPDSAEALGRIASAYYGHPAQQMTVAGITGTNGKTTCATLLFDLFNRLGLRAGLLSTIAYRIGPETYPATHTTPDPLRLQETLARMVEAGCEYCFMEVSSHALVQRRVEGIPFRLAMFTNITRDHLDYHGTFAKYIQAKKLLFDQLGEGATALVNVDDRNGQVMVQNTAATVRTFALKRMADYRARVLENTFDGLLLDLDGEEVACRLHGSFNAYNLLTVYAAARELGLDKAETLAGLSALPGAEGRFEVLRAEGRNLTGLVDYAHTPDALKNVLTTIADISHGGRVLTVVGAGGNRDRGKRPEMGKIAAEHSDQVIITSDNPRNEEPEAIIAEIFAGVPASLRRKVLRITDRREAIRTACQLAQPGDVILVAGKGHETYQEIKGQRYP
ncbi:MAG: UDP-N-acetylmuramoyl-L-alanyl-D-glutamate--2,6-diaminopimelate ligase, partial [Bacteroidetes bacterium]